MQSMDEPPKCEVCGKPATITVQDAYVEYGRHGGLEENEYSPVGTPHHFCDEHKRESVFIEK